jgi:molecular chaperone DnaK
MEKNKDILLGIDFGTTNTVITYFSNNKVNVLNDGIFKSIPSKIGKYNNKIYCGNYIPINCQDIIHSFKLDIDKNKQISFSDGQNLSYYDLLIIFFKHLYDLINKNLRLSSYNILKAVITVPSNFNDKQREIIKSAIEYTNIKVIRIINEPSAAALSYGLTDLSDTNAKILVIDTGGGTMDFTVLEKTETFFEIIHSDGLNNLGGNNFTELIYNDMINNKNIIISNKNILWNQAQKIKEKLSYIDYYDIKMADITYSLTRKKFINLSKKLIQEIEHTLQKIMNNNTDINYIILVGGTSRILFLQETIKQITNIKPWIHPNLETVVAEGAGLYAGIIENKYTKNNDVMLIDLLPLSLGVELADGSFSIIIPKNTPLPVKRIQKYTTDSPNDSSIKIKVYQGERKIANKNLLIGEFIFDKISLNSITPIIEIVFRVDLNSIINITVTDKKSGIEKNINIKDVPKIDTEQLSNIIDIATKLNDTDETELSMIKNKYLIKIHIENAIINLQNNNLIDSNNDILNKFNEIENKLDDMNNLQLIETLNYLQENFLLLGNSITTINDEKDNDVDKLIIYDRKQELINKINIFLIKDPSLDSYLQPILEEISYDNISIDYINEKINLLNELELENKDYKKETENLCLYLKTELENGSINLDDKNIILIELINKTINIINENSQETNWEEQLKIFNKKCEEIYNI